MTDVVPAPLPTFARRHVFAGIGAGLTFAAMPRMAFAAAAGLAATIEAFAAANAFNGVVLVGRNGIAIHKRAFGFADVEARRPARGDDIYGIASISKWLTALSVLRLVERGKLDLDAPITRWLPDYRADTGGRITLRHLLSNSSGLSASVGLAARFDPSQLSDMTMSEAVRRLASGDLSVEPGTRFDYIFQNWIIVAAIVETVTGRPFLEAMRVLTLDPLGLRHTDAGAAIARGSTTVPSYRSLAPLERRTDQRQPFLVAAGGYSSNAQDLLRAAHRVFDGSFLSQASRKELLTVQMPADDYALGGRVKTLPLDGKDRTIAWETGNTAGYRSVLSHRLDTRETVVILNNTSMSQRVLDDFAKAIFASL